MTKHSLKWKTERKNKFSTEHDTEAIPCAAPLFFCTSMTLALITSLSSALAHNDNRFFKAVPSNACVSNVLKLSCKNCVFRKLICSSVQKYYVLKNIENRKRFENETALMESHVLCLFECKSVCKYAFNTFNLHFVYANSQMGNFWGKPKWNRIKYIWIGKGRRPTHRVRRLWCASHHLTASIEEEEGPSRRKRKNIKKERNKNIRNNFIFLSGLETAAVTNVRIKSVSFFLYSFCVRTKYQAIQSNLHFSSSIGQLNWFGVKPHFWPVLVIRSVSRNDSKWLENNAESLSAWAASLKRD